MSGIFDGNRLINRVREPIRADISENPAMSKYGFSWCRVSLRTLFVLVGGLAVGLSILSWNISLFRREQRLAAQLMSMGFAVEYECERDERGFQQGPSRFETIMSELCGLEHFDHVIMVNGPRTAMLDDELAWLSSFTELRTLALGGGDLSDTDVAPVEHCRKLEYLFLSSMTVSDAAFARVSSLPSLQYVALTDMTLSRSSLESISQLPRLEELRLVTSRIDSGALGCLAKCRELRTLRLQNSSITDDELAFVALTPELRSLDLQHTDITDIGLRHVARISTLEWLGIYNAWVTKEGVDELQLALPNCHIDVHQPLATRSSE